PRRSVRFLPNARQKYPECYGGNSHNPSHSELSEAELVLKELIEKWNEHDLEQREFGRAGWVAAEFSNWWRSKTGKLIDEACEIAEELISWSKDFNFPLSELHENANSETDPKLLRLSKLMKALKDDSQSLYEP
ncbi:hypothetical protein, partial [Tautonia marina]|uniref:hypothetical protein n=1 Tax=Tautonia marina TaxID=2653855 RepID=UPI001F37B292